MNESRECKALSKPSQDFTPEVLKVAKRKKISLIPAIAISCGLVLLLGGFFHVFYFKNMWIDLGEIKKTALEPEIKKKEFSFKKAASQEKEPLKEASRPLRPDLNRGEKTVISEPVFQKYKSMPMRSPATSSAVDSTSPSSGTATRQEAQKETDETAVVVEKSSIDPRFLIPEGTYIPCSLTTKFTSDVTGRITCTVAEDIYGADGAVKLIEKGTRAIGSYQGGNLKHGVGRMFVVWTKLITPDFHHIKLVDSQVVGQLGEAGIEGRVDSHFFKRFGGAIMLSTVRDILKIAEQRGQQKENKASVNINTMGETKDAFVTIIEKMLENSINIPPTMYKNQGDIIGILVGRDIDFSKVYKLKTRP
jgi:type IV secretory pathway VirB10-like protein